MEHRAFLWIASSVWQMADLAQDIDDLMPYGMRIHAQKSEGIFSTILCKSLERDQGYSRLVLRHGVFY